MIDETKAMMKPHINAIKAIADRLMHRKTISGRLARKIFKEHLPCARDKIYHEPRI